MKYLVSIFILSATILSCQNPTSKPLLQKQASIKELIANLKNSTNDEVIVVAHRGDWRNAPENSLQAIRNCIKMGVDMVEIDIQETKDGHLVLMHDKTIDRTTNGSGYVKNWTLDSLKKLRLLDGLGVQTNYQIPTLEEALSVTKDKILVNLDKSYNIFDKCYAVLKKTATLNQVIIKGAKTRQEVESQFGEYLDEVFFMPVIILPNPNVHDIVSDYLENRPPVAIEFVLRSDTVSYIKHFDDLRDQGVGVWVNSLWAHLNGGHDDEKAILEPSTYDWYINNHIDIIQTDRPQTLLTYLREKELHK